jgi:outer membrane receptor for ferric coprogen and ferric-rhodotorulic acid
VIRPRIGFSHQDESFSSLFQTDNYFRIDDRDLVNVSVSYEAEAWSLQAFCINCSDETYLAAVTNTNAVYGTPRMAGVRFNRRF